jgi:hypothetical protein
MHIDEVKRMQLEKDMLMKHEGKHAANDSEMYRWKHGNPDNQGIDMNAHGVELQ